MLIKLKLRKMKMLYKILLSITALALLTLTSCLDDEKLGVEVVRYDEVPYVVDFNEAPNSSGFIVRSFKGTTDPAFAQEAEFTVNLSSPFKLDKDLVLTVEFDQAAVDAYVAANPGWSALPSAKQDFTSANITIPAGEREATFTVNFYTEGLSADDLIMAAYTITDVSDPDIIISGNFGTQYVKVGVANIFEGTYNTSEQYWMYGTTNYSHLVDPTADFITVSSVIVETEYFYDGWGDNFIFEVDLDNPGTFDGHTPAYYVTAYTEGWPLSGQSQIDDDLGGVWNYCYQNGEGKWVFKIAHRAASNSVGRAVYTQQ
jgi:hypothetical protein